MTGLIGTLGRWILNLLLGTVRYTLEGEEHWARYRDRGEPVVFALWHGRLLPLTHYHRGLPITAIISQSSDGEYIARVVEGWGYGTVRGSTSRGGSEALKGLIRAARSGQSLAITPDGPRGPRQRLQPGVLIAAQRAGLPLIPVSCGASRAWWPGSWDRFCVPKPFARVRIRYGEPREVPRSASAEDLQRYGRELEAEMNAMTAELDADGGPTR